MHHQEFFQQGQQKDGLHDPLDLPAVRLQTLPSRLPVRRRTQSEFPVSKVDRPDTLPQFPAAYQRERSGELDSVNYAGRLTEFCTVLAWSCCLRCDAE